MKCALVSFVAAAWGCGSPSHGPDGGPDDGPSPVTIISITPGDGTTKVGVLEHVTVQLSGAPDAASVTVEHVKLVPRRGGALGVHGVGTEVSYDDGAHAITLTPTAPLQLDTEYVVDVSGLTAGGLAIAPRSARFSTRVNPILYYENGSSYVSYEHDPGGHLSTEIIHTAGDDKKLGTSDDGISGYTVYARSPTAITSLVYLAPGADQTWRTADDEVGWATISDVASTGVTRSRVLGAPCTDKMWLTPDDLVDSFELVDTDAQNRLTRVRYFRAGPDGKAETGDDEPTAYYTETYAGAWDSVYVNYVGAGRNGIWFDDDDRADVVGILDFDDRGTMLTSTTRTAGDDGRPQTGDDATTSEQSYDHEASGLIARVRYREAAGADGTWGTADDVVPAYYDYHFDADGNLIEYQGFTTGDDGKVGTFDDTRTYVEIHDPSL